MNKHINSLRSVRKSFSFPLVDCVLRRAQARRPQPPADHVHAISEHSASPGVSEHALYGGWLLGAGGCPLLENLSLAPSAVGFLHCCNGRLFSATADIHYTWGCCNRYWIEQVRDCACPSLSRHGLVRLGGKLWEWRDCAVFLLLNIKLNGWVMFSHVQSRV